MTYVVNLKDKKYQFLTSLSEYIVKKKSKTKSEFQELGMILVEEAKAFVTGMFKEKKMICPYVWDQFGEWIAPVMPRQPDGSSCGVFTMMFCEEWTGNEKDLPSFYQWKSLQKKVKVMRTNAMRIRMCKSIMTDESNKDATRFIEQANEYYKKLEMNLQREKEWDKAQRKEEKEKQKQKP